MLFLWQWGEHARAIREQQSVAHVEENVAASTHASILPNGKDSALHEHIVDVPWWKRCNIQIFGRESRPLLASNMLATVTLISNVGRTTRAMLAIYPAARACGAVLAGVAVAVFYRGPREDVYNILWAVVFGFATLNILGLASRRMEPGKRGLSFGELMAVMVVVVSVFLLGWELLGLLHIFPIRLHR